MKTCSWRGGIRSRQCLKSCKCTIRTSFHSLPTTHPTKTPNPGEAGTALSYQNQESAAQTSQSPRILPGLPTGPTTPSTKPHPCCCQNPKIHSHPSWACSFIALITWNEFLIAQLISGFERKDVQDFCHTHAPLTLSLDVQR